MLHPSKMLMSPADLTHRKIKSSEKILYVTIKTYNIGDKNNCSFLCSSN